MKKLILLSISWITFYCFGFAQPYVYYTGTGTNGYDMGYINLATCETCVTFTIPFSTGGILDVIAMPNGQVVTLMQNGVFNVYDPPNPIPTSTFSTGATTGLGAILSPNGTIYYFSTSFQSGVAQTCLNEYNPATNTTTLIGCASNSLLFDLFFWNGTLFAFGSNGLPPPDEIWGLYSIAIGNPLLLTLEETYPSALCGGSTAAIPGVGIYTNILDPSCDGTLLFDFDIGSNTIDLACEITPNGFAGLSEVPSSFPPPPTVCGCETVAGEVNTSNNIICTSDNFSFSNTGSSLEPDDALQFILFSNPNDTLGSILLTSNSPSFSFANPPLSAGVTYYVAAIAGNELPNGNVDLVDPCLDISNAVTVVWQPLPSVTFSIANPNVCQGNCTNVQVTFTGSPPYTLTYTSPLGQQTQTFGSNAGTLSVCVPGSFSGPLTIAATNLTDANCTCN